MRPDHHRPTVNLKLRELTTNASAYIRARAAGNHDAARDLYRRAVEVEVELGERRAKPETDQIRENPSDYVTWINLERISPEGARSTSGLAMTSYTGKLRVYGALPHGSTIQPFNSGDAAHLISWARAHHHRLELIAQLRARFPWLGYEDEDASGGDVIDALNDWYQTLRED